MRQYLIFYFYKGSEYQFKIYAEDWEDAENRVSHIQLVCRLHGEILTPGDVDG